MPGAQRLLRGLLVAAVVSLTAWLVLQLAVGQVFTVTAASMEPSLSEGDRVLVLRPTIDRDIVRGDVVVADVRGTFTTGSADTGLRAGTVFAPAPADAYVVKRAVAGPGDRLRCCTSTGRLVLNGEPLDEPYLAAGTPASTDSFDVLVPDGRWWLMGDNRDVSEDSRAHLGSPGGGTVSTDVLIGRVVASW